MTLAAALQFPPVSPEIFTITIGSWDFALRWYAMGYVIGILIGWRIALAAVRRPGLWPNDPPMSKDQLDDFLTWLILGVILGGRIGYVLFYKPAYFLANPAEIIAVGQGGLSFHGGFLGVVLVVWLFSRKTGVRLGHFSDIVAISATPAILLVRIANFINAELWGRPTDMPWGVIFPGQAAQTCANFAPGLCARHPSQLYEAAMEGLILGAVLLFLAFRRGWFKTPWALTGLFFAGYGAARLVVELFRQADAQFITAGNPWGHVLSLGQFGLTMGQLLSLPMLILGVWLVITARRQGR